MTDSNGDTVWRGASSAWGRSLRESTPVNWDTPQNLRFQGQYLDRETGLHYNTFRYYDPAAGCYTQMDPIGLLGGLNTYTYVVDPLGWVDPLGLVKNCTPEWKSRRTFKKGDSGLKDHARRHSNLTAEEYLSLGRKNITDGRMLKGGKYRNARYHIRKIGEDNYSLTIADKNNKILSIDTWKNGGAPLTKVDILRGLEKSGVTPPKDFWEKL